MVCYAAVDNEHNILDLTSYQDPLLPPHPRCTVLFPFPSGHQAHAYRRTFVLAFSFVQTACPSPSSLTDWLLLIIQASPQISPPQRFLPSPHFIMLPTPPVTSLHAFPLSILFYEIILFVFLFICPFVTCLSPYTPSFLSLASPIGIGVKRKKEKSNMSCPHESSHSEAADFQTFTASLSRHTVRVGPRARGPMSRSLGRL